LNYKIQSIHGYNITLTIHGIILLLQNPEI